MKSRSIIFIFFNLIFFTAHTQIIKGVVKDNITKESLPYVNIALLTMNYGATTDELGNYILDIKNRTKDTLLISYLGYSLKKIPLNKFEDNKEYELNISLKEQKEDLEEVMLIVKKANYTASKKLGVKKKKKYPISLPFGYESLLHVKNENSLGKINTVTFFLKERLESDYDTYPAYFRVNFYKYDKVNEAPGNRLTYESILIKPENRTDKITINLSEYHVLFPVEGVCVGIEIINPNLKDPENPMYATSPNLMETHDKEALSWTRFRGKKWNKNNRKSMFKKKFYTNPLIQLEVQHRK